ncbi:hypothetical protein [Sphingomonas sp. GM_Shp_1]|uniref:hypothetical protein n=1 Tax=Sphingomonas sp. GM_Shp_1 TaxID=2937381 RepID=UPI00226B302E|nr:hypothetical protein [Sphingomonas sp. GM_Shp_1]
MTQAVRNADAHGVSIALPILELHAWRAGLVPVALARTRYDRRDNDSVAAIASVAAVQNNAAEPQPIAGTRESFAAPAMCPDFCFMEQLLTST